MELDIVFAEPSGLVVPDELRNVMLTATRGANIEIGPVVLVLDGSDPETPLASGIDYLTKQQAGHVDAIVISKLDIAGVEGVERLEESMRELNDEADVWRLSAVSGTGVQDLFRYVFDGQANGKEAAYN